MERKNGVEVAAGPWEVFALGALAPLGPFAQVHLAPKVPPGTLNTALMTYLSLEADELLLALIDGGMGRLVGCCALTTRRIYWVDVDDENRQGRRSPALWPGRRRRRELRCQAASYEGLPATITESRGADGSVRLDLGSGRVLVFKSADARLPQLLAHYLEVMRTVARTGIAPSLSASDAALAERVARAWPAVVQVTHRARNLGRDVFQFRRALDTATPHAFVTPILIMACAGVYAAMVFSGVSPLLPTTAQLVGWGANNGERIILRHEYWRFITSVFLHAGLIHIGLNMWCLIVVGPLVERLFGNGAYAVLYLAAGIGGAIASVAASPVRVSVGASGAICGILGALLAFLLTHRRSIPLLVLRPLRGSVLCSLVFIAILGMVVPNIDQAAHLGGLATGFFAGLLLSRPWPVVAGKWVTARRVSASILISAALAGTGFVVTRRGEIKLPPAKRLEHFMAQIEPTLRELGSTLGEIGAIDAEIPSSLALRRDHGDGPTRQAYLGGIQQLLTRGTANLQRLRRATTPDVALRGMLKSLAEAQSSQLVQLQAARRYVETGHSEDLTGPEGFLAQKAATDQAVRAFHEQNYRYLSDHGLIARSPPPQP
jgi:rhomboid protease GluP